MTTLEILKKAKEHISDPAMWFQGAFVSEGSSTQVSKGDSPCCAWGALIFAVGDFYSDEEYPALDALEKSAPNGVGVPAFNDDPNTTHADIMALFDRAITAEEARQ